MIKPDNNNNSFKEQPNKSKFIRLFTDKPYRLVIKERFDDNIKDKLIKTVKFVNIIRSKFYKYHQPSEQYDSLNIDIVKNYNLHRPIGPKKLLCYAPFNNIYFTFDGSMISCCYTRKNVLGKYPDDNIKDAWFGDKYNNLRNKIINYDLTGGCDICKTQLESKNYTGTKALLYDKLSKRIKKYPSSIEFELSNICNLECIMCTGEFSSSIQKHRDNNEPTKSPYNKEFVNQLVEFIPYLKEAKFYGGEPFLINIYFDIWEKIIEINPKVKILIQTNATVLNDRVKAIMERGKFSVNVSIDAINKETFEAIRKNADHNQVMKNIEYFHNYSKKKKLFFGIVSTPIRQSWQEIPEIVKYCNKLNVSFYLNTYNYPYEYALWNLEPSKLDEIYNELSKITFKTVTVIQKRNVNHYNDFLMQIKAWRNDRIEGKSYDLQNVFYK